MQAGFREVHRIHLGKNACFKSLHTIKESATWICTVRVLIGHGTGRALRVPLFAGGYTSMAANADIEINNKSKLFARLSRCWHIIFHESFQVLRQCVLLARYRALHEHPQGST